MIYPQTKAIAIGKWGCLAMCYIYCMGIEDEGEMLRLISKAMDKGILDGECTVLNAGALLEFVSGKKYSVIKKPITTIKNIKSATPVRFKTDDGCGHWVVVRNGQIVFNSLLNSVQVSKGKPVDSRPISLRS